MTVGLIISCLLMSFIRLEGTAALSLAVLNVLAWCRRWPALAVGPGGTRRRLGGPVGPGEPADALGRGIHLEQDQMARLARENGRGPVALQDLGSVAYCNRRGLYLRGLGSSEVREARLNGDVDQSWIARIVEERSIRAIMTRAQWFGSNAPDSWCLFATLNTPSVSAAHASVAFLARSKEQASDDRLNAERCAATLPRGAARERHACA